MAPRCPAAAEPGRSSFETKPQSESLLMFPEDDDTALKAILDAVDSETERSRTARLHKKTAASLKSPLHAFVVADWMSVLLLAQALIILILSDVGAS